MITFPYRKTITINGTDYPYEVDFLPDTGKFWLAFMGDYIFFSSIEAIEHYLQNEGKNIIADYKNSSLPTKPVGFLPMDDEEREELQANSRVFVPSVTQILASIEKNVSENVSIRINPHTLAKIKQFSEKNGVKYQTFINATLDELAKSL